MRANIILLAAQHIPSYKITRQLNLSKDTVGLWRRRYLEEGYRALLKDRPRCKNQGGKSTIEQEKLRQLIIKAALNVATGEVLGECRPRHRHQEFLAFLKTLEKQVAPELDLPITVDNYSTHKHETVKNWLKRNKRVTLHFIPTSSSWLNRVERFFGLMTDKAIRRGVFSSVAELERVIAAFIRQHNASAKPFKWTKSVSPILEKTGRDRKNIHFQIAV